MLDLFRERNIWTEERAGESQALVRLVFEKVVSGFDDSEPTGTPSLG